jgi:hypothetical protein
MQFRISFGVHSGIAASTHSVTPLLLCCCYSQAGKLLGQVADQTLDVLELTERIQPTHCYCCHCCQCYRMYPAAAAAAAAAAKPQAGKVLGQVADQTLDVLELTGRISLSTTGHVMFGYDAFDCTNLQEPNTFWEVRGRDVAMCI